jgi:hypothetical protein
MKFYPKDWLSDPDLSQCTATARGVWVDMLSAMHANGRTGTITGTATALARTCRCTEDEMRAALDELKATGTATVTEDNGKITVINRRMSREHNAREAGKRRALAYRERLRNAKVTPEVTGQKSEGRGQKAESDGIDSEENTYSIPNARKSQPNILETEAFKAFWKAYPRDIGRGKCWKHWYENKLEAIADKIMAGLQRWKVSKPWHDRSPEYPLKWLNEKMWKDNPKKHYDDSPNI